MKKALSIILVLTMAVSISLGGGTQKVEAASKYISVGAFINDLISSMKLEVDESASKPYVKAAIDAGIIKEGEFKKYSAYITRTDAAVLLNRADEYLHGDSVDAELLAIVLEKRISDLSKVTKSKREAVARIYAKGIITGYSNGNYSHDRIFSGSKYLTKSDAKIVINRVIEPGQRAKLSPDGQVIRTTNLPKYAKYYPYILESYPNQYYDWKFRYEGQNRTNPITGEAEPYVKYEEYASPAEIDKITYFDNFSDIKKEYIDIWVGKVKTYMECVFNVDYRTIDEKWIDKIVSADYSYGNITYEDRTREKLEKYIVNMKVNKTVVESSVIAVDGSSLYYSSGNCILRVYVKYRIISSNLKYGVDIETLIDENSYSKILYTRYPLVSLSSYNLGEWKECCFDVDLACSSVREPNNVGVFYAVIDELYYDTRRVD